MVPERDAAMTPDSRQSDDPPSMEGLVEAGAVMLDRLHPGGLALTSELAHLCSISRGARVLDVACGTGESAIHVSRSFGAEVVGLDQSQDLLTRASGKVAGSGLPVALCRGDAHALPFSDGAFDVAICECTLCLLDKSMALGEMVRVVRPGGYVGIHDLYWRENAPLALKRRLAESESEEPETLDGWQRLFTANGLVSVVAADRSALKDEWMRDARRQLGLAGQVRAAMYALRRWGFGGLWKILRTDLLFSDARLGYALVAGQRPPATS
jgi:ubiquinone/menaquinone biosynthesis C-methylase UbiE